MRNSSGEPAIPGGHNNNDRGVVCRLKKVQGKKKEKMEAEEALMKAQGTSAADAKNLLDTGGDSDLLF